MTWNILLDVLLLLTGATILGAICERFRQSAIVGYLLAGMLLGPHAFNIVSGESEVELLAELGVALLLFTIGLEFSVRRLRQLGSASLLGGVLQVSGTLVMASLAAGVLGAPLRTAAAVGGIVALSSTAVVLNLLVSRAELDSVHGRTALGILLVQDMAVVPLVLMVESLSRDEGTSASAPEVLKAVAAAIGMVIAFVVLFNHLVPWILGRQFFARYRELPILLAVITAAGATWAAHFVGLSPALGAFIAGMLLGSSPFAVQIRADVISLRALLLTLFFSSVGMYADPVWIAGHAPAVLGLVIAIVAGKALITAATTRALGLTWSHAAATGCALAQVGEFSFVLATVARGVLLTNDLFMLFVSATIVSLMISPYLVRFATPVGEMVSGMMRRTGQGSPAEGSSSAEEEQSRRVLIIGYGPAGRAVAGSLFNKEAEVHVLDLNPRIHAIASAAGGVGHVGDATQREVLEHAGVAQAQVVVVTVPDASAACRVIQLVRWTAPGARIVARARYHIRAADLRAAGADKVVDEEDQVGLRLAADVRKLLRTTSAGRAIRR